MGKKKGILDIGTSINILLGLVIALIVGYEILIICNMKIIGMIGIYDYQVIIVAALFTALAVILLAGANQARAIQKQLLAKLEPSWFFWAGWLLCFGGIIAAGMIHPAPDQYILWAALCLTAFPVIMITQRIRPEGLRQLCDMISKVMVAASFVFAALNYALVPFIERAKLYPLNEYLGFCVHPNPNGALCSGFAVAALWLIVTDSRRSVLYAVSLGFSLSVVTTTHCRSAELGLVFGILAGAAYFIRTRGLPGRDALKRVIIVIVIAAAICYASGQVLLYIDGINLNRAKDPLKSTTQQEIDQQEKAKTDAASTNEGDLSTYDLINRLSSDRLTIWTAYIPKIKPLGNGKITGPLTKANPASFSAHNNVLEVLYVSGWPAGAGFVMWLLYGFYCIFKNTIVREKFRPEFLFFILSFSVFLTISMLNVMQYPFVRMPAFMAYLTMGAAAFGRDRKGPGFRAVKRLFDIAAGLLGCVLILIMIPAVKLAQLLTGDRGPVFYSQIRTGYKGREFRILKFRTMVTGAEIQLKELLEIEKYKSQWNERQKIADDPRITKVGRFLRKNSLDEIPQFWNVLKGEMSMVGPRPLVPGELESFGGKPLYMDVRPGMTGWWICHGHHDTTYSERLELEYYYIRNRSFKLDLICIVRMIMPAGKKESEKNGPDRKQKS